MSDTQLTIKQLRALIQSGTASDPIVFLESILSGVDPRSFSGIYKLLREIDDTTSGEIDPGDWFEIMEYVENHATFAPVPLSASYSAAKTLAEYLHPKRKQVEINTTFDSEKEIKNLALTEEEIIIFKEKFNDEF